MKRSCTVVVAVMGILVALSSLVAAQDTVTIEIGKFSAAPVGAALPDDWNPLTFKKIPRHTHYEVVKDGDISVVKAISEASASGLIKKVTIDPQAYPIVRWRWKVENLLKNSDVSRKAGDDYPVRLYIAFQYDPDKVSLSENLKNKAGRVIFSDIPIRALNYIWETHTPIGTIVENAFTDVVQMIVVESGSQKVGVWVEEERNIYEDYKKAFGEEPSMINGVAIMSDTNNTKEKATAYYGDIVFLKAR